MKRLAITAIEIIVILIAVAAIVTFAGYGTGPIGGGFSFDSANSSLFS